MTDATTLEPDNLAMPTTDDAPQNTAVWFELPASDLDRAIGFYERVLKTKLTLTTDQGPNPYAVFPTRDGMGVSGHIYPGTPAKGAGPTVHLAVPDTLEATLERAFDAGGEVQPGIIPLPVGRFAYATDTEGNSIGLFQPN